MLTRPEVEALIIELEDIKERMGPQDVMCSHCHDVQPKDPRVPYWPHCFCQNDD